MGKIIIAVLLPVLVIAGCKSSKNNQGLANQLLLSVSGSSSQIIADHSIVADYDKIPAQYMAEVKKMMVWFAGESHSSGYRIGMQLLEAQDANYACNVGTGEAPTDQYVRVNNSGCGEARWFTWYAWAGHNGAYKDYIKNLIAEYSSHGHPAHAIGFGWCWDLTRNAFNAGAGVDPVFGCRWAGSSEDGPDDDKNWGLDAADYALTSNHVSMETYLGATDDYNAFSVNNGYVTKAVFTTGPADLSGESGYQGHVKHEYIRNHVKADRNRILFDYADILCYDNNGNQNTTSWNGNTFPTMAADNMRDLDGSYAEDGDHIGERGALRIAKAQWWMLARIAGWNGK